MPAAPERWYNAYITTYIERDVRQLLNVRDLGAFQRFVALCAGHSGQLFNASSLGADVGVTYNTIRTWLDIFEVSFILFRLRPHHRNFRKRLVTIPKPYFYDTGLACPLLGIEAPEQLAMHPMRGALFENWVVAELLKSRSSRGKSDNLFFWRNHVGQEIDIVAEHGQRLLPVEIKAGSTLASERMIIWRNMIVRIRTFERSYSIKLILYERKSVLLVRKNFPSKNLFLNNLHCILACWHGSCFGKKRRHQNSRLLHHRPGEIT